MGIAGSAMSTLVGNTVSLVGLFIYIYAKDLPLRLRGRELHYLLPNPAILKTLFVKGLPMGIQMIVISVSALALVGMVNREGVDTTAAFGVALQLWTYVQMPAMALGAAVSAMASQNIGAGKWDRVGQVTRVGIVQSLLITGGLIVLLTLADRTVQLVDLDARSFEHWGASGWKATPGCYTISVGGSSRSLPLQGAVPIAGGRCDGASARRCTSRRRIDVHLRGLRGRRIRSVTVSVNGSRQRVRRGGGRRLALRFSGRQKGIVRVRMVIRTRSGARVVDRRVNGPQPRAWPPVSRSPCSSRLTLGCTAPGWRRVLRLGIWPG